MLELMPRANYKLFVDHLSAAKNNKNTQ